MLDPKTIRRSDLEWLYSEAIECSAQNYEYFAKNSLEECMEAIRVGVESRCKGSDVKSSSDKVQKQEA